MTAFPIAIGALLLSIGLVLNLPRVVNLTEANISANNVFKEPFQKEVQAAEVAGVSRAVLHPVNQGLLPPDISAVSAIVLDLDSGYLFFVKNPDKQVPIASTTKLMTAIVALKHFDANDLLTVPDLTDVDGSTMGLITGETLTFRSLLYGMLLNSGNDAAFTIAANYPGGKEAFIRAMNKEANSLGLLNTHFDNPAGFDSLYHFSSAQDLGRIADTAARDPQILKVVGTKEVTVFSIDNSREYSLKNLNKLLGQPGVLGMKTGTTPQAKENLVGLFQREERKILTVVLGSNDRFLETQQLLNWVDQNFLWQ